jgi:hypothetical protein
MILLLLLLILLGLKYNDSYYYHKTSSQLLSLKSSSSITPTKFENVIKKEMKKPILKVIDNKTQAKITLIGVSHGSKGSASLVKDVINDIEPACIVLELCEDRYLSISISSSIEVPKENITIYNKYNEYMEKMKLSDINKNNNAIQRLISDLIKIGIYVKSQGVIGGFFLIIGLFFSSFQRINQTADEFATAMIEAGNRQIPIRLGDASQNDTMNSMKKILDVDTFNPKRIYNDSIMFLFSFFGWFPLFSNQNIPKEILKKCEWLVIPEAYIDDLSMIKSLWPLLLLNLLSFGLDYYPSLTEDSSQVISTSINTDNIFDTITSILQMEIPPFIAEPLSYAINLLGVLIVIRIAKLIGADRDIIIASKIQEIAKEFPNKEVVVVIGMLHANGIIIIIIIVIIIL